MPSTVIFLGTSAGAPTKCRNVTSHALRLEDHRTILLDCGEGTQHQLQRCADIRASRIEAILITHLHGDHVFGLQGLLASLSLHGRREGKMRIVGPEGLKRYLETTLGLSETFVSFPYEVTELKRDEVTRLGDVTEGLAATAYPLKHRVSSFGYLLEEPSKRGQLDAQKATALGITNRRDFGVLTSGKDVTLPDGRVVRSADVMGESRRGRRYLLLGDTCDSDSTLACLRSEDDYVDVVVHEATLDASQTEKALEGGHSTTVMAAEFAKRIRAKRLILTHFSGRYHGSSEDAEATEGCEAGHATAACATDAAETGSTSEAGSSKGAARTLTVADLGREAQERCPDIPVLLADDFVKFDIP